jgi:hypothetical protein
MRSTWRKMKMPNTPRDLRSRLATTGIDKKAMSTRQPSIRGHGREVRRRVAEVRLRRGRRDARGRMEM